MEDYSNYEDDYSGMGMTAMQSIAVHEARRIAENRQRLAVAEKNYRAHPNAVTWAAFTGARYVLYGGAENARINNEAVAAAHRVGVVTAVPPRSMTVAQAAARHVAVARAPRAGSWGEAMTVAQAAARHVARARGTTVHVTPPPARGRVYATPPPARGRVYVTPPPSPQARAAAQAAQRESRRQLEIARLQARNAARTAAARRKILQTISGLQVQIARAQAQLATLH